MDILGIGHAMADIFIFAPSVRFPSDSDLPETWLPSPLKAGGAVHLFPHDMDCLLRGLSLDFPLNIPVSKDGTLSPGKDTVSGGTSANILKAASALGAETMFIGTTGTITRDEYALFFQRSLAEQGVSAHLASADDTTGRCLILHLPDGTAAIAASPGAARRILPEQLEPGLALSPRLIVIEGMLCGNTPVMERLTAWCAQTNTPLAIDLASPFAAKSAAPVILSIVQTLSQVLLFANEIEATVFAETISTEKPKETVFAELTKSTELHLPTQSPLVVEKLGAAGARCWQNGECTFVPAVPVAAPLDATGAGDTFAGAFLTGWLSKQSLKNCLDRGNTAARLVLDIPGTAFTKGMFKEIWAVHG
jgi:sugar/nucleoside kinase (ribokinase family)